MNIAVFGRKHYTEKIIKWSVGQGICVKFVVAENSYENKAIIDYAISNNIKILNPTEIYEKPICLDEIDLIVSYLFPYKIKEPFISGARKGCINFHPAILPDWRGTAGYNIAIMNELTEWGATAHYIDENIDTGPIIRLFKFNFDYRLETSLSLERKTQALMLDLYKSVITDIVSRKELFGIHQVEADGVYVSRRQMNDMKLVNISTIESCVLDKMIKAFWFPPHCGAGFFINENYYTIINQEILNEIGEIINNEINNGKN